MSLALLLNIYCQTTCKKYLSIQIGCFEPVLAAVLLVPSSVTIVNSGTAPLSVDRHAEIHLGLLLHRRDCFRLIATSSADVVYHRHSSILICGSPRSAV